MPNKKYTRRGKIKKLMIRGFKGIKERWNKKEGMKKKRSKNNNNKSSWERKRVKKNRSSLATNTENFFRRSRHIYRATLKYATLSTKRFYFDFFFIFLQWKKEKRKYRLWQGSFVSLDNPHVFTWCTCDTLLCDYW